MGEKMKVLSFRAEPELIAKLRRLAKKKRENTSLFIRKILWKRVEVEEDGK